MDSLTITEQTRKPGRPKKQETVSPQHEHRTKEALRQETMKEDQEILDDYYILTLDANKKGHKLIHCTKTANGTSREYVGRSKENVSFIEEIKKQGKLRS